MPQTSVYYIEEKRIRHDSIAYRYEETVWVRGNEKRS